MNSPSSPDTYALALAYARAVDDRDYLRLGEVLTSDVRIAAPPTYEINSRDQFLESVKVIERYDRTFHMVGNHSGEWRGEAFVGETYCIASHLYAEGGQTRKYDMGIRYQDRIVREGAVLRFRERVLNIVWTQDAVASLHLKM